MPFERIQPEKIADSVVRQIERLILEGILRPGERLPAERELSERLGVSRPSLRDAIAELRDRGLLVSRAGSGIFVADVVGAVFAPALVRLFGEHERAMFDVIAFRRDMEALAAERATRFGSDTDLAVISTIFDRMEAAHLKRDVAKEASLDAEFHLAIIEAGHNVIMLHMMRSMYDLLKEGVFFNRQIMFRQRTTRASLLDQHREINKALQKRDAQAARRAIEYHLDFVSASLEDHLRAEENERIALRRLEHEKSR